MTEPLDLDAIRARSLTYRDASGPLDGAAARSAADSAADVPALLAAVERLTADLARSRAANQDIAAQYRDAADGMADLSAQLADMTGYRDACRDRCNTMSQIIEGFRVWADQLDHESPKPGPGGFLADEIRSRLDAVDAYTAKTPAGPRVWALPDEPGPEVTAVRAKAGRVYRRVYDGWRGDGLAQLVDWHELLRYSPLTDATAEPAQGAADGPTAPAEGDGQGEPAKPPQAVTEAWIEPSPPLVIFRPAEAEGEPA